VEPHALPDAAVFGSTVTVRTVDGTLITQRIVGVDEVDFHPGGVSWISALGKALLGTELGQRLILDDATMADATVVKIE
jgi:transcription elongation GreA/GreB family factor